MYTISQLFIYPVKSLGGFEVVETELTDRGFKYDRRWMIIDSNNNFLTQREFAQMSLLQTAIFNDQLIIFNKDNREDKIAVSLHCEPAATIKVTIWEDECSAQYVSADADKWLTDKLKMNCRLVYMPDAEKRKVDEQYALHNELTNFSDGYPLMMIGQASLDELNGRLPEAIPMDRFRPNIVFTGGKPFEEDTMKYIKINAIDLFGVKLCARCNVTTIDQRSSLKSKEPLKTLSEYRLKNNKIYFGQNLLFQSTGTMQVGNIIELEERKVSVFDEHNV